MMKATIEIKDNSKFKLTVAKDRVAIKVPSSSTKEERELVIFFLQAVADKIVNPEFTHRGHYNPEKGCIKMSFGGIHGKKGSLDTFFMKDVLHFTS